MAKTNWDPYSGQPPPPPPPPRSLVNHRTKPVAAAEPSLLPPPSRSSSAGSPSLSRGSAATPPPPPSRNGSGSGTPPPPPPRGRNAAPPAPPPRATAQSSLSAVPARADAGPPPIVKSTRPGFQTHHAQGNFGDNEIDWVNLTPQDKEVFFSWLDEYFANFSTSRLATGGIDTTSKHDHFSAEETHSQQTAPPPLRTMVSRIRLPKHRKRWVNVSLQFQLCPDQTENLGTSTGG